MSALPRIRPAFISRRNLLLAGLALPLAGLGLNHPAAASADTNAAIRFIDSLGQQTLGILNQPQPLAQRETQLRELLRQGFDLAFIGRFVLGRPYASLSQEQAADYHQAFNDFVLRTYARRLSGFQARSFAILGARAAGDTDTEVSTRIDPANGQPVRCDWRVRQSGQRLGIIDVAIENVSMAVTQRNEFASVVNTGGVNGLIGTLRARADRETVNVSR